MRREDFNKEHSKIEIQRSNFKKFDLHKRKYPDEELLCFLKDFFKKNNRPPSIKEILILVKQGSSPGLATFTSRWGTLRNACVVARIIKPDSENLKEDKNF